MTELALFLLLVVFKIGYFQYVRALTLGGDPWTSPVIWSSVYPSLHLSLDEAEPFTLHNGAQHVVTQV